ncbi:MAG: TIM barrel protein [Clostridiaceae bacterium]|nr:TIM barrel protein [Clostridiaceae bacterium]
MKPVARIGISLPFALLADQGCPPAVTALSDAYGGVDRLLDAIAGMGTSSVELRAVTAAASAETVDRAVRRCAGAGLTVTVHGTLRGGITEEDFLAPYRGFREPVTVTVHALTGCPASDTVHILQKIAAVCVRDGLPLCFAVENNRRKGTDDPGDSCEGALGIASQVPGAGVCWDMGHFYYNALNFCQNGNAIPEPAFLCAAVHTHIHGVDHGRTHFPPGNGRLPLAGYIEALQRAGYGGVYNFEPSIDRWEGVHPRDGVEETLALLREIVG